MSLITRALIWLAVLVGAGAGFRWLGERLLRIADHIEPLATPEDIDPSLSARLWWTFWLIVALGAGACVGAYFALKG